MNDRFRYSGGKRLGFATLFATVGIAATSGDARAAVGMDSTFNDSLHGGAVTDSWAGSSSPTTFATGNLKIQIPAGAVVKKAYLLSIVMSNAATIAAGPGGMPRGVILGPGATLTRQLEGTPDRDNGGGGYALFRTDVTTIMQTAIPSGTGASVDIPIQERGDELAVDAYTYPKILGHSLVVIYELASVPLRNVAFYSGTVQSGATGTVTFNKPVAQFCAAANPLSEAFPLSVGISWEYGAGAEENDTIRINGNIISSTAGGSDDGTANVLAQLYTGGSLGAGPNSVPIGIKGDVISGGPGGGRADDELYSMSSVIADNATSASYQVNGNGDEGFHMLLLQTAARANATDADGDGVLDATEGACTDSDLDGVPDYLDLDSDNDCLADAETGEAAGARTDASLPVGNHCTGSAGVCVVVGSVGVCKACAGDFGSGTAPACTNSATPICITSGTNVGACSAKAANAQPTLNGQTCAAGVASTCASGVCESRDGNCGFLNGTSCSGTSVCRSNVCHTDGKCGLPQGVNCTQSPGNDPCRTGLSCSAAGKCEIATDGGGSASDAGSGTSDAGTDPDAAEIGDAGVIVTPSTNIPGTLEGGGIACATGANSTAPVSFVALLIAASIVKRRRNQR